MKSKDLQKLVLSKYEAGQTPKKIFEDLNGAVSYPTVKRWCKMIRKTGAIDLSKPSVVTEQFARRRPYKRSKENQRAVKGFLAENWRLKWTCLSQVLIEFSGKILK